MRGMEHYFPHGFVHYLAGGLLIGAGVVLLFVGTGAIGGASSVFSAVWSWVSERPFFQQPRFVQTRAWRVLYALGMVLGALLFTVMSGDRAVTTVPWFLLLLGGFVAGFGARLGNGCTSGHGVCGLGSLQLPSLVAVLAFLATAFATANLVRALGGPA
jgi:uncharacterized membrane protein YedE/YeeE